MIQDSTRSRWLVRDNHKSPLPKKNFLFLKPLESAERFRCIFPIKYTHRADRRKKIRRDSSWWWWRTIRRKMTTRPNFGGHNSEVMDLELRKCHQINRNHSVSQTPEGVRSSYSGVSKYSPVLQDCKVWASSDHWSWRYTSLFFFEDLITSTPIAFSKITPLLATQCETRQK